MRTCTAPGCQKKHMAKGCCAKHYMQVKRNHGQLLPIDRARAPHGHPAGVSVCYWLPLDLIAYVEARAKREGTTRSRLVTRLLRETLTREAPR